MKGFYDCGAALVDLRDHRVFMFGTGKANSIQSYGRQPRRSFQQYQSAGAEPEYAWCRSATAARIKRTASSSITDGVAREFTSHGTRFTSPIRIGKSDVQTLRTAIRRWRDRITHLSTIRKVGGGRRRRVEPRQPAPARRSWRRHLLQLVRPHGAGGIGRRRAAFGADAVSQELDSGALYRPHSRAAGKRSRPAVVQDGAERAFRVRTQRTKAKRPEDRRNCAERAIRRQLRPASLARALHRRSRRTRSAAPARSADDVRYFVVGRSNTLAHAAAKQVARRAPRRSGDVQPALHPRRRRPRQDAPAPRHRLGGQCRGERKVVYLTAEKFMYGFVAALQDADRARVQGGAARHRPAGHRRHAVPAGQVDAGGILPHAQRADRRRPAGRGRRRPAAGAISKASTSACARGSPAGSSSKWARSTRNCGCEILKARVAAARPHHPGFDVPAPVLAYIAQR